MSAAEPVACRLRVDGMDCGDCAKTVEQSLRTLPGVADVTVQFIQGTADVRYDPALVSTETMARRVNALGYRAEPDVSAASDDGAWSFDVTGMDCADCARTVQVG